jgi:NADPH2:quinone reductase
VLDQARRAHVARGQDREIAPRADALDDVVGQPLALPDGRVGEPFIDVNLDRDLGVLALRGRIVVIGNRGTVEINARQAMTRDAAILGMVLWNTPEREMASVQAAIGAGLANGTLRPIVGQEIPLAEAARAHEAVMSSGARGKIVLVV